MWPGESAIGKRYRVAPHLMKTPWFEIVGVVGHISHDCSRSGHRAQAYWSFKQWPMDRMALVVQDRAERVRAHGIDDSRHSRDRSRATGLRRPHHGRMGRSIARTAMDEHDAGRHICVGRAVALRDWCLRRDRVRRRAAASRVRHPARAWRKPARHRDSGRQPRTGRSRASASAAGLVLAVRARAQHVAHCSSA